MPKLIKRTSFRPRSWIAAATTTAVPATRQFNGHTYELFGLKPDGSYAPITSKKVVADYVKFQREVNGLRMRVVTRKTPRERVVYDLYGYRPG